MSKVKILRKRIKQQCPSCQGSIIVYKRKGKTYWCRSCGTEWQGSEK
jgi:ribosomal protein L37AE/L43A